MSTSVADLAHCAKGSEAAPHWGARRPTGLTRALIAAARWIPFRGLKLLLLGLAIWRHGPAFDIQYHDLKMRVHPGDNSTERALLIRPNRLWEGGVTLITDGLDSESIFLDIGANCGLFTLFAARRTRARGCVIAIEPDGVMAKRLRFNIAANGFARVCVVEAAAGSSGKSGTFYVNPRQRGLSSMLPHARSEPAMTDIRPLLDIVREIGVEALTAAKIDVEGYEDRILLPFFRDAPEALWPGSILIETKHSVHWEKDCVEELCSLGYAVAWKGRNDALLVRPPVRNSVSRCSR